jgi:hypothetical protein
LATPKKDSASQNGRSDEDVETPHPSSPANRNARASGVHTTASPSRRKIGKLIALDPETMLRIPEGDDKISLSATMKSAESNLGASAKAVETRHSSAQPDRTANLLGADTTASPSRRKIGKLVPLDPETMLRIPESDENIGASAASKPAKHS